MTRLRLFVGVPLPEDYQQQLQALRDAWKKRLSSKMSWTKQGNWHLTLKFLGDTDEALLPELCEALAGVRWKPFELQAGGGGVFPPLREDRPMRPKVLWVGLRQGATEATALSGAVETALVPLGFAPETRPFRPHLTLARIKMASARDAAPGRDGQGGWQALLAGLQAMDWPGCSVDSFILWQSRLLPEGPVYTPLASLAARD